MSLSASPTEQESQPVKKTKPFDTDIYAPEFEVSGTATLPISNHHTIKFDQPVRTEGREIAEAIVTKNFFTIMLNPEVANVHNGVRVKIAKLSLIADPAKLDLKTHPYAQFYPQHTWAITQVADKSDSIPPTSEEVENAPDSYVPAVLIGK